MENLNHVNSSIACRFICHCDKIQICSCIIGPWYSQYNIVTISPLEPHILHQFHLYHIKEGVRRRGTLKCLYCSLFKHKIIFTVYTDKPLRSVCACIVVVPYEGITVTGHFCRISLFVIDHDVMNHRYRL